MGRERPEPGRRTDFSVRCLGGLDVVRQDATVVTWTKRPRELFTLLLSAPTGAVGRDEVAESIWPDSDPLAAHRSVRSTVTSLRRLLGAAQLVRFEGPAVRLLLPLGSRDDVAFEQAGRRALAAAELDQVCAALDLYTGTYLAQDRYSDWTIYRRQVMAGLRRELVMNAATLAEQRGMPHMALTWLAGLLAEDRCDEAAARWLMRLYLASGRRSEALRTYHAVEAALRADLDVRPETETTELFTDAKAGGQP
jgi:DNA-binding SARP family transcriptional activator